MERGARNTGKLSAKVFRSTAARHRCAVRSAAPNETCSKGTGDGEDATRNDLRSDCAETRPAAADLKPREC